MKKLAIIFYDDGSSCYTLIQKTGQDFQLKQEDFFIGDGKNLRDDYFKTGCFGWEFKLSSEEDKKYFLLGEPRVIDYGLGRKTAVIYIFDTLKDKLDKVLNE